MRLLLSEQMVIMIRSLAKVSALLIITCGYLIAGFNTADINTGWDGRANNGKDVAQEDVFVWKVKLTDVFGVVHDYIGTVTIVK